MCGKRRAKNKWIRRTIVDPVWAVVSIRFLRASSITYIKKTSTPVVVTPRLFASRVLYSPSPRCRVCPPITICHLSKRRRQTPRSEAESAPHRFSTCFSPAGRKRVTRRRLNLKRTTTRRSVPCARTWSKIQPCLSRPGGASSLFDRAL